jgi:diacylglycerol kinase
MFEASTAGLQTGSRTVRSESLLKSFQCAIQGVAYVFRTQRNAKLHAAAFVVVLATAAWLQLPPVQWAVLILTAGLVFVAEVANTVIETLVDLVSPDYHELAGRAKDVAAGGVLCAAVLAAVVGLILMGPPLVLKVANLLASAD